MIKTPTTQDEMYAALKLRYPHDRIAVSVSLADQYINVGLHISGELPVSETAYTNEDGITAQLAMAWARLDAWDRQRKPKVRCEHCKGSGKVEVPAAAEEEGVAPCGS